MKLLLLAVTHVGALLLGVGLGIYLLPILTAPEGPTAEAVRSSEAAALFTGEFSRDRTDSDVLHWGEGALFVGTETISFRGRLAPGPDYRLFLSPEFVETEDAFKALRPKMVEVAPIKTFENFMVAVPESTDPGDFKAAIIWCEAFGQFITSGTYQGPTN